MSAVQGEFREHGADPRVKALPLSHLSLELGHLYMEDLVAGPARLEALFAGVAPWVEAATASVRPAKGRPRVSTCFLVDDYFSQLKSPDEVVPMVLGAAAKAGVTIHYLAREAACAMTDGPGGRVSPAELLVARLVEEPEPGTTGWRPSAASSGWLSNGRRSPATAESRAAMDIRPWAPPVQNAARKHSIFVDVQLWDDDGGHRTWSCPLLAATWQLLRLGLLRYEGEPVVAPAGPPDAWPDSWARLPAVTQLVPKAPPFAAYGTASILSPRFLPVEVAVRTILAQVWTDPAVSGPVLERAAGEGHELPEDVLDRIEYVFAAPSLADPPT